MHTISELKAAIQSARNKQASHMAWHPDDHETLRMLLEQERALLAQLEKVESGK